MKNRSFYQSLSYALTGVRTAFQSQRNFRIQCLFAVGAILALFLLRPKPLWWALICLAIATVLTVELINTALEFFLDRLHPEQHPLIAKAKDCAAGAVLIISLAALGVAGALVWDHFNL